MALNAGKASQSGERRNVEKWIEGFRERAFQHSGEMQHEE